ncbi:glycopeptide antibiotics resistance protein [Paenibacillus forsythiae]|uniref:Glycopeptide antibiotics resistance protein n=1 Tax=Paenibacillus forsythiae TaxID=365616 RepID=A0ABU3H292_9BACL|nr:VanZ family protein [Paenibacillus forsythiae]MDT3424943.1 glycopeptide antibiotics resistance protein [Paenibacillus forsythiae]
MLQFIFNLLFGAYALLAINIILFKTIPLTAIFTARPVSLRSINLIPFHTIGVFFTEPMDIQRALTNICGNIVIFVPLGIFISYIGMKRSLGFKACILLMTALLFEILQYIFALGSSDVDDILLNFSGGLIGIAIYSVLSKIIKSRDYLLMAIVGFFLLAGISGALVIWKVDGSLLPFATTETVYVDQNKQLMAGLDERAADLFGELVSVKAGAITVYRNPKYNVTLETPQTSDQTSETKAEYSRISYDASTKIIIRHISSVKDQLISRYEEGTATGLGSILDSTNIVPTVKVWLSSGNKQAAQTLLISFMD